MSRNLVVCRMLLGSFPRVSGDEPSAVVDTLIADRFSPRERG